MRVAWLIVIAAACAQDRTGPADVYAAPSDAVLVHGCVMLSLTTDATGACYARWTCEVGGERGLLCEPSGSSTACTCLADGSAAVSIATTPTSCDAAVVTTFAGMQCGWEGL